MPLTRVKYFAVGGALTHKRPSSISGQRLITSIMQVAVQHASKSDNKTRNAVLKNWLRHKLAAAFVFFAFSYPACVLPPSHHVLEFHLGNWLRVSPLARQGGEFFSSPTECRSHFQRRADERERSGAPPGQNLSLRGGIPKTAATLRPSHWSETDSCSWSWSLVLIVQLFANAVPVSTTGWSSEWLHV